MKYNVGDIVRCPVSKDVVTPELYGVINANDAQARSIFEFTIIACRGAGYPITPTYLLLVPDDVPPEVGWLVEPEHLEKENPVGHYNIPNCYLNQRVIGCYMNNILDYAPINKTDVVPINLSNKEKELCDTIDVLEKELTKKDEIITALRSTILILRKQIDNFTFEDGLPQAASGWQDGNDIPF